MCKEKLNDIVPPMEKVSTSLVNILTRRKWPTWFHVLEGSLPPTAIIAKYHRSTWLFTDYLSLLYYAVVNGTKATLLAYLLYSNRILIVRKALATGDLKGEIDLDPLF
jgi:hypothetical protein